MSKIVKFFKAGFLFILISLFSLPVLAAEGDILLFDDFSDGNLNGWTIESGNWFINNGNLAGSKSGRAFGGRISSGSSAWDNYKIELDFNAQSGIDHGVGFRYTPGGDSYEINFRHGTGLYNTPEIILRKNQSGVITTLFDTHSFPLVNQKWYRLKVELKDENIKAWIGETLIFDTTDSGTLVKKGTLTLSYWTGDISNIYVRFDNIKLTALAPPTSLKTPLILIPGIAASLNRGILTDRGDSGWSWMFAAESGWRQFIDSLEKAGYQKDKDYFIAFYDWRKTNDWTDPDPGAALPAKKYLAESIDKAKMANPGVSKVNVVAHSMGGLVVRSYVESPNYRSDISKAFLIGTPNSGSSFAYYTWEGAEIPPNWDPLSKAGLSVMIKLLSFNFNEEPYQMIHNHIKGIKDLLPIGYDYLINNGNPFNWINMQEINNFLKNTSNPQNTANIFATKEVELFNIIGTGQNTWEKLQTENYIHPYLWKDGKPIGSAGTADGDNTITVSSSNLTNITGLTVADKHANLPNAAASLVFNKLGIAYTQSSLAGAPDEVMVAWVASPVTLTVKDTQGNSVGESLIDPTTDMKWVFVENPSGDYKIALTGTGSGDYHVGVDYYIDSKTESAVREGTAVSGVNLDYNLNFDPQNPQPLQLQPVDNISSSTITQLQGISGSNGWFLSNVNVSLSASDNEGGTGLKEIQYSFDNSTWQIYTQPLTANAEGITTIYYYSSDLVGNKEEIKKVNIKIDKTTPEASFSFNPDLKELEIQGKDNHSGIDKVTDENGLITITDKAGHSLKLWIKEKEKPRRDKISVESISYDNQTPIILEENRLKAEFSWDKKDNILRELEQEVKIKGDVKMTAHFSQKKNQTKLTIKEEGAEKQKIDITGLVLLKLITNKGNLEVNY